MISRRAFLSALSVVPFIGTFFNAALAEGDKVGRSVPTPREVREIKAIYFSGDGYGNGSITTMYRDGWTQVEKYSGHPVPEYWFQAGADRVEFRP